MGTRCRRQGCDDGDGKVRLKKTHRGDAENAEEISKTAVLYPLVHELLCGEILFSVSPRGGRNMGRPQPPESARSSLAHAPMRCGTSFAGAGAAVATG